MEREEERGRERITSEDNISIIVSLNYISVRSLKCFSSRMKFYFQMNLDADFATKKKNKQTFTMRKFCEIL